MGQGRAAAPGMREGGCHAAGAGPTRATPTLRLTYWCCAPLKPKALSRWFMARSNAFINLYLRDAASARSQRRRHFSRLPPLPGQARPPCRVSHVLLGLPRCAQRLSTGDETPKGQYRKHMQLGAPSPRHRCIQANML